MIESVDEGVGHIMCTLDEFGLSENTLVVFTSDNGGEMCDHQRSFAGGQVDAL